MATGGAPKTQIEFTAKDSTAEGLASLKNSVGSATDSVVDSANKASNALDGMGAKGEEQAEKLSRSSESIARSMKRVVSDTQRQNAELRAALTGGDKADAFSNLIDTRKADAKALQPLIEQVRLVRNELSMLQDVEARAAANSAFRKREQETEALRRQAAQVSLFTQVLDDLDAKERQLASNKAFITSLQEQSAAIGKTRADLLEMKAAQMGLSGDAAPYIAQLRAQEQALVRSGKAMNANGKSAGELNAALRNVPAQFTDIFVSLASGQQPLTVLLQQGGQLKDMFGGIGPAFKAIGGYALGLVNPFTVLAAAVGVLGVAYYQGSQEQDAYVKSLVLTGNAAGATAGQMKKAAQEAADATNTTVGANAEAIAALAGTGKVSADNFKAFSQTVVTAQRDLDIPLKETIKNFEALGESPVKASAKLNESMRYLTTTVYEQIVALEQQGKKTEAAELAQKSYASAMDARSAQLKANLGSIERGWNAITLAAKKGWDAILNVGRAATNADRLGEAQKALEQAQKELGEARGETQTAAAQKAVNVLKERVGLWQTDERQARQMAALEEKRAEASEAGVRFTNKSLEVRTKEKKLEDEIAQVRADGLAAGKSQAEVEKVITAMKAAQAKSTKGEDRRALGRDSELAGLQARIEAVKENTERYKEFGVTADKVTEGQQAANKIQKELSGEESKRMDKATRLHKERMMALNLELGAEQEKERNEKQRAIAIEKSIQVQNQAIDAANKETDAIERQNDSLRANIDAHGKSAIAVAKANQARAQASFDEADSSDAFLPQVVAARQRSLDATKEQVKLLEDLDYSKITEQLQDQLDISMEQNKYAKDDIRLIGMSESERRKLLSVREIELRLARELQKIDNTEIREEQKDELRGKARQKAIVDAETAAIKESNAEWVRWYDDLNKGMGDALETAIFDGSKKGAEKMREVLQEALLRKPLRMLIDATMNQISGGILQLLGGGGGGGVMGAAGGSSPLGSLFSVGSAAYQAYSGQGALGSAWQGLSSLFGGAAASGTGAGAAATAVNGLSALQPVTIATNASYVAPVVAGQGSAAAAGAGSWGAGGIAALIALAVINAVGGMRSETMIGSGLAGKLGGNGSLTPWEEWREGGTLVSGPDFTTGNPLEVLAEQRRRLQVERDEGRSESNYAVSLQATVTSLEKSTKGLATQTEVYNREIQKGYKKYRDNVVQMADSLGLGGDALKNFVYELGEQDLNFQGLKPEEIQAKISETFGKAGTEMAEQLIGSFKEVTDTVVNTWSDTTDPHNVQFTTETTVNKRMEYQASVYAKAGETAIDTLTRLATSFNAMNEASDMLGFGIHKGSLALANMADEFIEAAGGMERFRSVTSSYFQNYFSEDKQREYLARSGARQFETLGIKGITADMLLAPGAEQAMVAAIETLVTNPELYIGAQEIANGIVGIFRTGADEIVPAAQETAVAVDQLTEAFKNAVKSMTDEKNKLMVDLRRAQGDEVGARALERQQYLDSFVDDQGNKLDETRRAILGAMYDVNIALKDEIDLRKEMLALTQTNSQALNAQRAALSESNKVLFDQVQALKLIKPLADISARVISPAQRRAAGYDAVASTLRQEGFQGVSGAALAGMSKKQIVDLWTSIYNLGETSDITRSVLIDTAGALLDLKDAASADAANALETAYSNLEKATEKERTRLEELKANIEAVFDTLESNVRDLYGEVAESRDALAREGLRFINEAYQKALTSGALPDSEDLTNAISDARAGIEGRQFTTQFEADKERLLLAGKLSTLQELAGDQLTEAEKQLEALDKQLQEARALVDVARKQLDATYQGTAATGSVAAAVAELARALVNADKISGVPSPSGNAGRVISGTNGAQVDLSSGVGYQPNTGLPWIVDDVKAAAEQALLAGQTKQVYDVLAGSGFTLAQANAIFDLPPGTAEEWAKAMGYNVFHEGMNFVPETGMALLQRGEQVVRAGDNPFGAGAGKSAQEREAAARTQALLERIVYLLESGNGNTGAVFDLLDQVTDGGNEVRVGVMNGTGRPVPTKAVA